MTIGELAVRLSADVSDFKASMGEVTKQLDTMGRQLDNMSARLGAAGTALTASVTAPILGLGYAALESAAKFEQTEKAFTTLFGSAETAKQMLADLSTFAAKTPFELPQVLDAAKKFRAMGFEANEIIPTLTAVGNAASAVGLGADGVNRLTLALGQMRAKGKVSAEEMKQLVETGIPAWEMLAQAIGVSVPEAMKLASNGAIDAATGINALISGMNGRYKGMMEEQSKTFLGQLSNLSDDIRKLLQEIGSILLPFAKSALDAFKPILETVRNLAIAFTQLPGPVQNIILGVLALAAAIGPLLLLLSGVSAALSSLVALPGTVTAAMGLVTKGFGLLGTTIGGVALPALSTIGIALAVVAAAFAAWKLGEWLYNNFTPFKEAVDALVDVLGNALAFTIEAVKAEFYMVKDAIAAVAEKVMAAIQWFSKLEFVKTLVEAIANKFGEWLGVVKKFFGDFSNELKTGTAGLKAYNAAHEDTGKAIGKTSDATKKGTDATKTATTETGKHNTALINLKNTSKDASDAQKKFEQAQKDFKKATEEATQKAHDQNIEWKATVLAANDAIGKYKDLQTSVVNLKAQQMLGKDATWAMNQMLKDFNDIADTTKTGMDNITQLAIPAFMSSTTALDNALKTTGDAFAFFKDTASNRVSEARQKIETEMQIIKNSGVDVPTSIKDAYDEKMKEVEEKVADTTTKSKGHFGDMATNVSTVITNFAQDISKSLWDGDMSWAEKGKKLLKDLGQAVTSSFIEPATAAIGDFIKGAITDLLSGKGLGGVLDSIKEIGTGITGIFSGAGGSTPSTPSVPTGGGGGGAAGSAVSGITGIVGAVGSVVSAVSGVIGNFQMAGMNKSLDLIEKSCRYTEIYLHDILTQFMIPYIPGINDINFRLNEMRSMDLPWLEHSYWLLVDIKNEAIATKQYAAYLPEIAQSPRSINVEINGITDPDSVASAVMDRLTDAYIKA